MTEKKHGNSSIVSATAVLHSLSKCNAGQLSQPSKGAGYSDGLRKTTEELSGMGTSRHPKVLKSGPNHGCQWIFKLKKSRRHKTAHMAQKLP